MSRTISSLEGYARKIRGVQPSEDEVLLYRGHSKKRFTLVPSVLRTDGYIAAEHTMLRELVASHPADFAPDATTLEQLARAQHYSLPTRLLDVTWNPLVALYFAAKDHDGETGQVIVFRIKKERVKFYDSDTVSCVANLAYLSASERASIDWKLKGKDFNDQTPIQRLLHFIRAEKPYFRDEINPDDLQTVLCVKPKRNSQRILVQAGAFLLFGIFKDFDTKPPAEIAVERISVNGRKKLTILKEIDTVAINESTLFPEIEKAAQYIRDKS